MVTDTIDALKEKPSDIVLRFYKAEGIFMRAGGVRAGASFDAMAALIAPDAVLRQSPDLP